MKQLPFLALFTAFALLTSGCSDDVNCVDEPDDPDCIATCEDDPTLPGCVDMSMPGDGGDDLGPDGGGCGDCPAETPLCRDDGMCVACLSEADCTDPAASVCNADGACEVCGTDADCDHDDLPGVCVAGEGCFECGDADTQSTDCAAAETPVCDDATHACRACAEHSECDAGLCADGACPAAADIVWVDKDDTGCDDSGSGTTDEPFCEIEAALGAGAEFVAVRDSSTAYAPISWTGGGTVSVVAVESGGTMTRIFQTGSGAAAVAVECTSGSSLSLTGVRVEGNSSSQSGVFANDCTLTLTNVSVSGNGQAGVSATGGTVTLTDVSVSGNGGVGVTASAAADITIRRSIIQGNDAGGLSFSGVRFDVENTVLGGAASDTNGDGTSSLGGALLAMPMAGSRFVNNTVANNFAGAGLAGGVICAAGDTPLVNTLLWNNSGGMGNVSGCSLDSSSEGVDPSLAADGYHLTAASTCCVDMADDSAAPADDIDGDERPCGAGADIGADELCP